MPNSNIPSVFNIITNGNTDSLQVIMDSAYYATRKYVSDIKDNTYVYPLVHSTPKSGIRYKYSSTCEKGHFGKQGIIML